MQMTDDGAANNAAMPTTNNNAATPTINNGTEDGQQRRQWHCHLDDGQ
jgi:hypothetical protein